MVPLSDLGTRAQRERPRQITAVHVVAARILCLAFTLIISAGDHMPGAAEPGKEAIFEFIRTATEHSHVLFAIAGGLAIIEVLMVAHILSRRSRTAPAPAAPEATPAPPRSWLRRRWRSSPSALVWLLILSAIFNFASLVAGYFGDAALVKNLETYAAGHMGAEWNPPHTAEVMNLFQMGFLTLAFGFVGVAFLFFKGQFAGLLIELENQHKGKDQ